MRLLLIPLLLVSSSAIGSASDICIAQLERMSQITWAEIPVVHSTTFVDGSPLARIDLYGNPTPRTQKYNDIYTMRRFKMTMDQYTNRQKADQCMALLDAEKK